MLLARERCRLSASGVRALAGFGLKTSDSSQPESLVPRQDTRGKRALPGPGAQIHCPNSTLLTQQSLGLKSHPQRSILWSFSKKLFEVTLSYKKFNAVIVYCAFNVGKSLSLAP